MLPLKYSFRCRHQECETAFKENSTTSKNSRPFGQIFHICICDSSTSSGVCEWRALSSQGSWTTSADRGHVRRESFRAAFGEPGDLKMLGLKPLSITARHPLSSVLTDAAKGLPRLLGHVASGSVAGQTTVRGPEGFLFCFWSEGSLPDSPGD